MKAEELIHLQEQVIISQEKAIEAHKAFIELQDSIIKNLQEQLDKYGNNL